MIQPVAMLRVIAFVGVFLALGFHGKADGANDMICGCSPPNMTLALEKDNYEEACKQAKEALPCFQNQKDPNCTVPTKQWLYSFGVTEAVDYVCSDDVRQVYLDGLSALSLWQLLQASKAV